MHNIRHKHLLTFGLVPLVAYDLSMQIHVTPLSR
jgi:hypothetical protein